MIADSSPELKPIFGRVEALRRKYSERDRKATDVRNIREGRFDQLAPDMFNEEWQGPVTANLIDTMARDFAAALAPLPSFTCSSTSMLSDGAKKFADLRTKIVNHYVQSSDLPAQNLDGADGYNAAGLYAIEVTPDLDAKFPVMRILDGATVYAVWDRRHRTQLAVTVEWVDAIDLEVQYPDVATLRIDEPGICTDDRYEVIKYVDKSRVLVYLPKAGNKVLLNEANPLGRCFIVAVPRPSGEGTWNGNIHGAYDDLIWPQLARNNFQMLAMEAADKSVRAPIAVPQDVVDFPEGPDAIIRSNNPQAIQRVKVDVPQSSFQAMQWLERDMQLGGMTTQARMGQQGTGWTTGRGIEALGDSWSGQLAAAQEMLKFALQLAIELCFEWDELVWPNLRKKIRGHDNGVPFEVTYVPSKDIKGDHTVDVTYGFGLGMDPNRALVYLLQVLGAGLVSKDTAARHLPTQINASEELKKVDLEQMRMSIMQAMSGLAQSLPEQVANGVDPSKLIASIAQVTDLMQRGEPIEVVVSKVFAPPEPPPAPPGAEGVAGVPGEPGAGGASGFGPEGLPSALTPNVATQGPGGRPSLQMLFAGLSGAGKPNLQAGVSRMLPVAGGGA